MKCIPQLAHDLLQGGIAFKIGDIGPPKDTTYAARVGEGGVVVLGCDRPFCGRGVSLIVSPPELLPGNPVAQLPEADFLRWEFRAHGFHHLIKHDAHGCLFLILGKGHDIDIGASRCRQVGVDPSEHGVRDRVGVDLPKQRQNREFAWSPCFDLGGGIGDFDADFTTQPRSIDLIPDLPRINLREGGNEIDEALLVLGAGVALVVSGVDWLTEHLQAFAFGVVDQVGIGRRALPCIENHTDPSVGGSQIRGQIEVHLVVRNGINRKAEPW